MFVSVLTAFIMKIYVHMSVYLYLFTCVHVYECSYMCSTSHVGIRGRPWVLGVGTHLPSWDGVSLVHWYVCQADGPLNFRGFCCLCLLSQVGALLYLGPRDSNSGPHVYTSVLPVNHLPSCLHSFLHLSKKKGRILTTFSSLEGELKIPFFSSVSFVKTQVEKVVHQR